MLVPSLAHLGLLVGLLACLLGLGAGPRPARLGAMTAMVFCGGAFYLVLVESHISSKLEGDLARRRLAVVLVAWAVGLVTGVLLRIVLGEIRRRRSYA